MLAAIALVLSACLFSIGRWGRRNAESLVVPSMSKAGQQSTLRTVRRGAIACQVFAAFFLACGVAVLVALITSL